MEIKNYNEVIKFVDSLLVESNIDCDFVVGMSRGGLIPAAHVATKLNKPLVTLYIDKQDNVYLDRTEWLKDKNILFVDDICRSGHTLKLAKELIIKQCNPKEVKTLTIFDSYATEKMIRPDYGIVSQDDVKFPWDYDR